MSSHLPHPPVTARPGPGHRADPAGTDPTAAVLAAVETMAAMLSIATGLVAAGRKVELNGLEQEAARLCAAAVICPAAAAPALRGALVTLLARLDRLTAALRRD